MSKGAQPLTSDARTALLAQANELRHELHRYCARLMGSTIEGEDVVQDALVRAMVALQDLHEAPSLRPWLFRIAHNRALDLLRSRQTRIAEPIEAASEIADATGGDPTETRSRWPTSRSASRFVAGVRSGTSRRCRMSIATMTGCASVPGFAAMEGMEGRRVGRQETMANCQNPDAGQSFDSGTKVYFRAHGSLKLRLRATRQRSAPQCGPSQGARRDATEKALRRLRPCCARQQRGAQSHLRSQRGVSHPRKSHDSAGIAAYVANSTVPSVTNRIDSAGGNPRSSRASSIESPRTSG